MYINSTLMYLVVWYCVHLLCSFQRFEVTLNLTVWRWLARRLTCLFWAHLSLDGECLGTVWTGVYGGGKGGRLQALKLGKVTAFWNHKLDISSFIFEAVIASLLFNILTHSLIYSCKFYNTLSYSNRLQLPRRRKDCI